MTRDAESRTIRAVELFCGIGGLTHGLRLAGIEVVGGFDNDPTCRYAYEANNAGADFVCKDIRTVGFTDVKPFYESSDVTALVGCAPCQPFAAHNRGKSTLGSDCTLVAEFARLIVESKPDLVSMENVSGLAKHSAFSEFLEILTRLNYKVSTEIVSCEKYGVPQKRKRLVLLASRLGPISLPDWRETPPTVEECIRNLPPLKGGESCADDPAHTSLPLTQTNRDRIAQSKPGGSWKDWETRLINECHKRAHYPAAYGRMSWDDLAPTITTQFCYYSTGRFGHPEQDRAISVREAALLQTFPRNYELVDEENPLTIRALARHIGNAVPVKLGKAIGMAFKESISVQ